MRVVANRCCLCVCFSVLCVRAADRAARVICFFSRAVRGALVGCTVRV